ncbi:polysaccharide pyruvyl transferase family protein [Hoyosella sp. YIM 151337]|uniref:polysaccharide pyruvyl transferase family protein n=1 Tax=Hoyosella sp. YIM 151337 TaxID=2992742 RepID=UPI00223610A4|nr:polysaccharide pyruvyl transferase family protein [Hoyosella sp. YIM 151337]MCW4352630.1 polysaccharide pyruvyl transferase family protein [Hoyosella sp. YIM 151337]
MLQPDEGREVVYLIAPSGHPNYGDEFIAAAWLRYLARVRPSALVVLDCHTPGQAAVLLRGCHPRVLFVDTAWRLAVEASTRPPAEGRELLDRVVGEPGRACLLADGIGLLARASSIHLLGGGYLNTVWPHHLGLLRLVRAAARASGAPLYATGQGLMPAGDGAELRESVADFAVFDVRDDESARLLSLPVGGDDAWLAVPLPSQRRGSVPIFDTASEASRREFVLCLQSDLVTDDESADSSIARRATELLDAWGVKGDQVAVIEGIPGTDRVVFDQIADRVEGAEFVPFTELWRNGLPARRGQTWISTRFHPHLLAAATGASGVALSGRKGYYDTKHRSLTAAGSQWLVLGADASSLAPAQPRGGGFAASDVERMVMQKRDLAAALYPKLPLQIRAKQAVPPRARRSLRAGVQRAKALRRSRV